MKVGLGECKRLSGFFCEIKKKSTLMKSSKEFNGCLVVCLSFFFQSHRWCCHVDEKRFGECGLVRCIEKVLGGNMSLNGAIKKLDGVIDWLSICGATKSMGISCVTTESTWTTHVSIESMGASCAFDDKITINEGKLLESSTRVGTWRSCQSNVVTCHKQCWNIGCSENFVNQMLLWWIGND